ncbi:hypothetical protein ACTFIW_012126 [Dictyostelium discoideum]
MYAASGHYYSQGCHNKLIKIKGEQKLQDEFYQRFSKITGENILYPTNPIVSQCFTIEEKEWYIGSKPLISLIVKALLGFAFEFTSIPLYAPLN